MSLVVATSSWNRDGCTNNFETFAGTLVAGTVGSQPTTVLVAGDDADADADNAKSYRIGRVWISACRDLGIDRRFIRPGCPGTNGKAERCAALDSRLQHYNTARSHSTLAGHPPISRLTT